jgi:hypothetical protein
MNLSSTQIWIDTISPFFISIVFLINGIQLKIQGVEANERSKVLKERYLTIDFRSIQISTRILTLTNNLIFIPR